MLPAFFFVYGEVFNYIITPCGHASILDAVNQVVRASNFLKSDNTVLVSLKFEENAYKKRKLELGINYYCCWLCQGGCLVNLRVQN